MNHYAELAHALGGLPDDYLVVDVETNGMGVRDELTLPVQLGYLLVAGRRQVDCGAVVVDWSRVLPARLCGQFWDKVRRTEQSIAGRGGRCSVTAARIRAEGADPHEAWAAYHEMLATALGRGLKVAGFNIVYFDCPLLARVGLQMETPLEFQAHQLLDFGLFEKALSAGLELPHPDKGSVAQWYYYVKSAFFRGKWNLSEHCVAKYGLSADPALAHGADYDCWVSHQLVEAYRARAEEQCPNSPPDSSMIVRSTSSTS